MKLSKIYLMFSVLFFSILPSGYVLAAPHDSGVNVISNGTIYMIVNGQRRAYTSEGAFLSYGFNSWAGVVPASSEDLAVPEGSFIPPRDGKILCSDRGEDKGTCYLITNGKRSAFVSAQVFNQLGFRFAKAIQGDVSFLVKDADISTADSAHRPGVLINRNGTIFLVANSGLLGVPSPEILGSWGYSFADVIGANSKDAQLTQSSVMTARQGGQLTPSENSTGSTTGEAELLLSYVDSYPDLPTAVVNSPLDEAAIIEVANSSSPDSTLEEDWNMLSSKSQELLNRTPQLRKVLEQGTHNLYNSTYEDADVTVYEGGYAKVSLVIFQKITGYTTPSTLVMIKENGSWKLDLIGSIKFQIAEQAKANPTGAYITGSGNTDISIEGMEYDQDPVRLNDKGARFLIRLKNNGKSTIHQFVISLSINSNVVYESTVSYKLEAKEELVISVPIAAFWDKDIIRSAGEYRTDVIVSVGDEEEKNKTDDNWFYTITDFK